MKGRKNEVKLLIIGMTLVFLAAGLSGCNGKINPLDIKTEGSGFIPEEDYKPEVTNIGEITVAGSINKVKILQCETTTEEGPFSKGGWTKKADGFTVLRNEQGLELNGQRHRITGRAQNIAGKPLVFAAIEATFLDSNNRPTTSDSFTIGNLDDGEVFDFEFWDSKTMGDGYDPEYSSTVTFILTIWTDYSTISYGDNPPTVIDDKRIIGKWERWGASTSSIEEYTADGFFYHSESDHYPDRYWLKDDILYVLDLGGTGLKYKVEFQQNGMMYQDYLGYRYKETVDWAAVAGGRSSFKPIG